MLLFIGIDSLETLNEFLFQYISCYSLSRFAVIFKQDSYMFQYISCYSLSDRHQDLRIFHAGFNTSHVTLYQMLSSEKPCGMIVSIHLMLLFINGTQINQSPTISFQYISCYSLSHSEQCLSRSVSRFNTSHVTLYQRRDIQTIR